MSAERGLNPAGDKEPRNAGTDRFIIEWLARAHPSPEQARREWTERGVALLPCGRQFAAVRIPPHLVHAALGTVDAQEIAESLAFDLGGPVIHDGRVTSSYYALIQWHAGLVWDGGEDAPCLATDTYLGVPRIERLRPPGPHWVVAPRRDGDVCRPSTVRTFIARARGKLADAAVDVEVS